MSDAKFISIMLLLANVALALFFHNIPAAFGWAAATLFFWESSNE